jgi:hypothetical protein
LNGAVVGGNDVITVPLEEVSGVLPDALVDDVDKFVDKIECGESTMAGVSEAALSWDRVEVVKVEAELTRLWSLVAEVKVEVEVVE